MTTIGTRRTNQAMDRSNTLRGASSRVLIGFLCLNVLLVRVGAQLMPTNSSPVAITQCPGFCFCDTDWTLVSCTGDVNTVMPDSSIFAPLVQRLDYRNLIVPRLQHLHVQHLSRLRELSLVRCRLNQISNGTFRDSAHIERLDLSQNEISILSQVMLSGLVRLKSLDLSSNKLMQIGGALKQLTSLEHLNLRDNALLAIDADSFRGLYRLEFLNLDNNNVSSVSEDTFQDLPNLAHLILSHNPLTGLRHLDLFAAHPTYVDLSSADLHQIPALIARYVRDLRMSGNDLGVLRRGDFESYGQVKLLVLDENQITEIEADALGRMEQLEQLYLNSNRLSTIPISLPSKSLTCLFLESNRIATVKAADLQGLDQLQQLHLARNVIDSIEMGAFDQLTSLIRLDLSHNLLNRVSPDMFYGLTRLQVLDVSGNPVAHIDPMTFIHLPAIKLLNASPSVGDPTTTLSPSSTSDWETTTESQPSTADQIGSIKRATDYIQSTTLKETISNLLVTTGSTAESSSEQLRAAYRSNSGTSSIKSATDKWMTVESARSFMMTTASTTIVTTTSRKANGGTKTTTAETKTGKPDLIQDARPLPSINSSIQSEKEGPHEEQQPPVGAELKEKRKINVAGTEQLPWLPIGLWWAAVWFSALIGVFVVSSSVYCLTKTRWARSQLLRLRPLTASAGGAWKRRVVKSSRAEKDSIKMGWSVEDFDHWTTSLSIPPPPSQLPRHEDERLLLAVVSPHRAT